MTMAVKNKVEDSRTDNNERDSWMGASKRYRDRVVLNKESMSSASSTPRRPNEIMSFSMFFLELRRAGAPYFSRLLSDVSWVTSYRDPMGAGAISEDGFSGSTAPGGSLEFSRVVCECDGGSGGCGGAR